MTAQTVMECADRVLLLRVFVQANLKQVLLTMIRKNNVKASCLSSSFDRMEPRAAVRRVLRCIPAVKHAVEAEL